MAMFAMYKCRNCGTIYEVRTDYSPSCLEKINDPGPKSHPPMLEWHYCGNMSRVDHSFNDYGIADFIGMTQTWGTDDEED